MQGVGAVSEGVGVIPGQRHAAAPLEHISGQENAIQADPCAGWHSL